MPHAAHVYGANEEQLIRRATAMCLELLADWLVGTLELKQALVLSRVCSLPGCASEFKPPV